MRTPLLFAGILVVSSAFVTRPPLRDVKRAGVQAVGPSSSNLQDQVDLAVTVYNSDIALVRDVRDLQLPRGSFDLQFMDIAATVNPATVHFRSLTEPSRVNVLEQNYEYDLLEPDKLLRKYVGRDVTLVRRTDRTNGATRDEEVKARLLSYNNAPGLADRRRDRHRLSADHIKFPELPGNLYTHPTLIWTLDNAGAARHRVEASYLASKLSWNADYVLTVARDDKLADLDGWVTLTNGSGTSFRNAKLQLVAGDLNRVRQVDGRKAMDCALMKRMAAAAARRDGAGSRSPTTTSTRWRERRRSTTTRPSRSACSPAPACRSTSATSSTARRSTTATRSIRARRSRTPCRCTTSSRTRSARGLGMPMPAGHRPRLSGGFEGRHAVRRRGSHRPHAEGRRAESQDRQRVRRRVRAQPDRLREDRANVYEVEYEITLRNHKATPITRRGERTDRRHVADGALVARVDEDRGVGGGVHACRSPPTARTVLKYRVRATY